MLPLVAFDSNVLTAFINANSSGAISAGADLAAFQLFMYAKDIVILPTVTLEASKIPPSDKRDEHLKWVRYHFDEAQLSREATRIEARARELVPHHPDKDPDDCRIVAEAELASVTVLATIDKDIKRLQPYTRVQLLTPADTLNHLGIKSGAAPERQPASGHPLAQAAWRL